MQFGSCTAFNGCRRHAEDHRESKPHVSTPSTVAQRQQEKSQHSRQFRAGLLALQFENINRVATIPPPVPAQCTQRDKHAGSCTPRRMIPHPESVSTGAFACAADPDVCFLRWARPCHTQLSIPVPREITAQHNAQTPVSFCCPSFICVTRCECATPPGVMCDMAATVSHHTHTDRCK